MVSAGGTWENGVLEGFILSLAVGAGGWFVWAEP